MRARCSQNADGAVVEETTSRSYPQGDLMKIGTLALAVALIAFSAPAFASSVTKTVKQVEYRNSTATPDLLLQTSDGVNYQATATYNPGCGVLTPSIDTVKIWVGLGQAALLSGKSVTIYFTVCGSTNWIQDVVLKQ
jgi:hypothetical protein